MSIAGIFILFVGSIDFYLTGILVKRFLEYIEADNISVSDGVYQVLLLCLFMLFRACGRAIGFFICIFTGISSKAAFQALVYNKLLKLKASETKHSTGEIVNLCANDSQRVNDFCIYFLFLIYFPLHIIMIYTYLYYYFGVAAMASCFVLILYVPFQICLGKVFGKLRSKAITYTDKRVKMISEALASIKLIKIYAWEESFANVIFELRKKEKKYSHVMGIVQGFTFSFGYALSVLAPAVAIGIQMLIDGEISVPKAFTLIALNNASLPYVTIGPLGMRAFAEMLVTMKRLKKVMMKPEYSRKANDKDMMEDKCVLKIVNASFTWDNQGDGEGENRIEENETTETDKLTVLVKTGSKEMKSVKFNGHLNDEVSAPTLQNISLNVRKGSLIGICGAVGSGKSSLIQAIFQEMTIISGVIQSTESIAYVPQQPWIINSTLRENILLGKEYEESFYQDVLKACALEEDIKLMKSGDLTEIGERGVNLSGGQKQRVSLARALYAEKELYLLDDPLSSVDANVGQQIFKHCIQKALKKKSVVFVTHQLQYLKDCDEVIFMKNGCLESQGTYKELVESKSEFSDMLKKFYDDHKKADHRNIDEPNSPSNFSKSSYFIDNLGCSTEKLGLSTEGSLMSLQDLNLEVEEVEHDENIQKTEEGRLTIDEELSKGSISWKTYNSFIRAAGGIIITVTVLLGIGTSIGVQIAAEYCLTQYLSYIEMSYVDQPGNLTFSNNSASVSHFQEKAEWFLILYWTLGCAVLFFCVASVFMTVGYVLRGSSSLHKDVLLKMFHAPLTFFESTPIGQIVNRFSKDIDEIDNFLPLNIENFVRLLFRVVVPMVFICVIIPYYTIALFIQLILTIFMSYIFRKVVRALKRIDHIRRSPIYSHISTTIQGLSSLRCYQKEEEFKEKFLQLLDSSSVSSYLYFGSTRWFGLHIDIVCIFGICILGFVGVVLKDSLSSAIFALCLIYTLQVVGMLQFGIRQLAETESRFTSVERLHHYIRTLEPEGSFKTDGNTISKDWPENGEITFLNVSFRYQKNLPLALKDLTFSIKDKEKIGIVGRTGAGKSSIANVLFRLVQIESGCVKISGADISQIGLTDVRKNLSMIPQDPVLFIGTIRYNLDPFSKYGDEEIWDVLGKAHMQTTISSLPDKLETVVSENGSNFSVGERQLICMARALLRKSKILVLDEATAAIDTQTDLKIQTMIKDVFSQCTVLTIAHRLNTIMHCDRILVMDKGEVIEFDSPYNLLQSKDSMFRRMTLAANIKFKTEN